MMNSDAKISFGIDSILKSKKVSFLFFSLDLGPKLGFWGNWKWRKYFKGRKFVKFWNIRSRRNGAGRKTWIEPTSTTSYCCPTQSNQSTLSKVHVAKMIHFIDYGLPKQNHFSGEMNWYPNPTQLLGLNLNGYTNLTLQSHMAQRGLNLPFQLNQFQGMLLWSIT